VNYSRENGCKSENKSKGRKKNYQGKKRVRKKKKNGGFLIWHPFLNQKAFKKKLCEKRRGAKKRGKTCQPVVGIKK